MIKALSRCTNIKAKCKRTKQFRKQRLIAVKIKTREAKVKNVTNLEIPALKSTDNENNAWRVNYTSKR